MFPTEGNTEHLGFVGTVAVELLRVSSVPHPDRSVTGARAADCGVVMPPQRDAIHPVGVADQFPTEAPAGQFEQPYAIPGAESTQLT